MSKAQAKKKQDVVNELCTHVDLIGDEKVKSYIKKKRALKEEALRKKHGIHKKLKWDDDEDMESASEDEEDMPVVAKKSLNKLKNRQRKLPK